MVRYLRRVGNDNTLVALFALILLGVFAGPNILPRIVDTVLPSADGNTDCEWLRRGEDRALHQSLIGRQASLSGNPVEVRVVADALPATADETFFIRVIIVNTTIGTVPIYYNRNDVAIGDDGTSGIGIVFNAQGAPGVGGQTAISYPETDIRLLGPRQRCVHRIELSPNRAAQLASNIGTGTATVTAFYRNTARGTVTSPQISANLAPVFSDQGLWIGVVASEADTIELSTAVR